jgi:hypothetical protein
MSGYLLIILLGIVAIVLSILVICGNIENFDDIELMNTRMFEWWYGKTSGLANHADIVLLSPYHTIYRKPLKESLVIFLNTRLREQIVLQFIDDILPKLDHSVNLILAGEDWTFPNSIDKRHDPSSSSFYEEVLRLCSNQYINKIFVENLDERLPKTYPIPLGVAFGDSDYSLGKTYQQYAEYINIDSAKPLKITNFNRTRDGKGQWEERGIVFNLCMNQWLDSFIVTEDVTGEQYLKELGKYSFTLCVHGGGVDVNPKLWECLIIGVIPIIKINPPYTDIYIGKDLPIVMVEDWTEDTITNAKLKKWHARYYHLFEDRRQYILEFLSLEYWVNYTKSMV